MNESLTLTESEIIEATGYRQPMRQLIVLAKAGIPADRRADGSVRVWRHQVFGSAVMNSTKTQREPQLKSDRKAPRS
jgi:hypothetical protein